jgi:type IV pilus assembly protein PilV
MRYHLILSRQSGFTLIEVLVAVVVLSIGLLGLAGLQAMGLRNSHSAYLRSQATLQAYDMMDRMRANMSGFFDANGNYINPAPVENTNCLGTAGCSSNDMAAHDLYEWNNANASLLPSGGGIVCFDSEPEDAGIIDMSPDCEAGANAVLVVKLWWVDERSGAIQRFVTSFRP